LSKLREGGLLKKEIKGEGDIFRPLKEVLK
jgi:hypothetical protein